MVKKVSLIGVEFDKTIKEGNQLQSKWSHQMENEEKQKAYETRLCAHSRSHFYRGVAIALKVKRQSVFEV